MLIALLSRLNPRRVLSVQNTELPKVSLIIAAHNEEKVIGEKIENSLSIDYPEELLSSRHRL